MPIGPRTRRYLEMRRNPEGSALATLKEMERAAHRNAYRIASAAARQAIAEVTKDLESKAQSIAKRFKETLAVQVRSIPFIKGDAGDTPKKGVDYDDGAPGYTPIVDKDYPSNKTVLSWLERGLQTIFARVRAESMTKAQIRSFFAKETAKLATVHAKKIARALEKLVGADRLDYGALKNKPGIPVGGQTVLHRGGSTGVSAWKTPTETPDGVILAFTVTTEPTDVIADGIQFFSGQGYTYAALTITFTNPPTQYVRYR